MCKNDYKFLIWKGSKILEKNIDCDNFVIGNKDVTKSKPFGYNLPKVSAYLKETGKRFENLSEEELEKLK